MTRLVLLPGMDGTGSLFAPFLAALPHGIGSTVLSYPQAEALDYAGLEAYVRRALPDEPFVLVAESFSGPIAMKLGADRVKNLKALVLCCTFARCPVPVPRWAHGALATLPVWRAPQPIVAAALLGPAPDAALQSTLAEALARVAPAAWRARLRAVLQVNLASELPQIEVPTLYLTAARDRIVPRSAGQLVCRLIPGARNADIDSPHFLLQVRPREAARRILAFLSDAGVALP